MKPIQLVLSAFGPYVKRTVVDFFPRWAREGLFNRGRHRCGARRRSSTRSALRSTASLRRREKRKSKSFHSDYVSDQTGNLVELTFRHRGETWLDSAQPRIPAAEKKGRDGDDHSAGGRRADAQRGHPARRFCAWMTSTAAARAAGADAGSVYADGDDRAGRFLKILTASSDDRKKLFRDLFHTNLYVDLQSRLQGRKNRACADEQKALEQVILSAEGENRPGSGICRAGDSAELLRPNSAYRRALRAAGAAD